MTGEIDRNEFAEGEHPMTGASKILTVSYGTFSCTLEGFDDPFNTMRAIAEYFRDLAAEDRYFGAEPPTPDAAMLHRIAEREIHRRVEAKIQDNGVILRAAEDAAGETALAAPEIAAPAPVAAEQSARPAPVIAVPAQPADAPRPALLEAAPAAESAVAKLQRLRAAQEVAPAEASVAAGIGAAAPVEVAAETPAIEAAPLVEAPAAAEALHETPDLPVADEAEDILAAIAAQTEAAPAPGVRYRAEEAFEDLEPVSDFDDDFVLGSDMAGEPAAPAADEPAETTAEAEDLANLALLDGLSDPADLVEETFGAEAFEEEPAAESAPESVFEAEEFNDDFLDGEAFLAALNDPLPEDGIAEAVEEDADFVAPAVAAEPAAAPRTEAGLASDDALLASLGALIDPEDEAEELIEDSVQPLPARPEAPVEDVLKEAAAAVEAIAEPATDATPEAAPEEAREPAASEKLQRARARVIRIRRADPAKEAEVRAEAKPAAVIEPADQKAEIRSLLTPEAEAALQAELAELEAELAPEADAAPRAETLAGLEEEAPEALLAAETEAAAPEIPAEFHAELRDPGHDEDAVSRLIARTNSAMDGEDSRRRHSAIAHLKAAVAATVAERQLRGEGADPTGAQRMDPYREDLDRVVRPRRPQSGSAGENAERPSPLVLVSEQRIDRPRPVAVPAAAPTAEAAQAAPASPVVPVRPRRVASSLALQPQVAEAQDEEDTDLTAEEAMNLFSDAQGFEDFADRLGATRLPDLLEAAAVYCAEVLQRPEFSRPLLLRQISTVPGGSGLSREDCLRSFGTLLRQGRITKLQRGQFALTDRSPYLAEAKRISG